MTDFVPSLEAYPNARGRLKFYVSRINVTPGRSADDARTYMDVSPGLHGWLQENNCALALSSYDTGQLILVGARNADVVVSTSLFERATGIAYSDRSLWLCTRMGVQRFENIVPPGRLRNGFDCIFLPRVEYVTGYLDAHEISIGQEGSPIFANTLYSCVSQLHRVHSFSVIWKPDTLERIEAKDANHINGLCLVNGTLKYVTGFAEVKTPATWRDQPINSGFVLDIQENTYYRDLIKPHSPRYHLDALWAIDSGRGFLVRICPRSGTRENIALLPGFARGLSFIGPYALVTTSLPRQETFQNMEIEDNLKHKGLKASCSLTILDLRSKEIIEYVRFFGRVRELLDVCVLNGVRAPLLVHPESPHFANFITAVDARL